MSNTNDNAVEDLQSNDNTPHLPNLLLDEKNVTSTGDDDDNDARGLATPKEEEQQLTSTGTV